MHLQQEVSDYIYHIMLSHRCTPSTPNLKLLIHNVTSQLILNNHGKGGHGVKQLAIHNPKILISLDLIMIGVN